MVERSLAKVCDGQRLGRDELIELFEEGDLLAVGRAADEVRKRLHPDRIVTYVVDRNINYSNVCVSACRFCAFFRREGRPESYQLRFDEIASKIDELCALGGTRILMQGGLHPGLPVEYFERLFRFIKARFPIRIHSLSPPEIVHIARLSGLETRETLERLQAAGLDSLPGGGAEILADAVRVQISPRKCTTGEWLDVMRAAHGLAMPTTATMMFGHVETHADRVAHLLAVRGLQDETGGFYSFIPWTFQPTNTDLAGLLPAGGHEYLKTLAISRIALDNVPTVQASWVTQGDKIAQLALRFGANDMGSTMMEENVVRAAGVSFRLDREGIEALIRGIGFEPRQRGRDVPEVARVG